MIGYKKRPSGAYANEAPLIASSSLNVTLSGKKKKGKSYSLRVRMKGTSLASIFSDLNSYPSDNESVRARHTSVLLKCELFKKGA